MSAMTFLYGQIMKKEVIAFLLIPGLLLFSCKKTSVKPSTDGTEVSTPSTNTNSTTSQTGSTGSDVPETSVTGFLRFKLAKDSINTDGILISFNPTAKPTYVPGEDAPSLRGFGAVSLASLSSDNIPLAINALPLAGKGRSINLTVGSSTEGIFKLNLESITSIPASYEIWLKDGYKKDSLDMRQNPSYAFNIYKADTASSGSNRFKLVFRYKVN